VHVGCRSLLKRGTAWRRHQDGREAWFNGVRLSPHIFNTESDLDAALRAIRTVLA
jgi:selenocysteine lyase/cysteine desulfurase